VGRVTAAGLLPALRPAWAAGPAVLNDYWWGSSPSPVEIPFAWVQNPAQWVEDPPLNVIQVTGNPGASLTDADSVEAYGESAFSATLATATALDATTLAQFVRAYYATGPDEVPRVRFMGLRFVLNAHSQSPDEIRLLLGVREGRRISITGTPATWPDGASEQVVEGIAHSADDEGGRFLDWITSPVIGVDPGEAGPWFKLGTSFWGGTDVQIF